MLAVLIRHPAVQVARGTCYGRLDPDVHSDAAADMARIAAAIAGVACRVWTSPARRCRGIAGRDAIIDDRLRELDFGAWEGQRWDDLPRDALDRWAAAPEDVAPPGGETGAALLARVGAFHAALRARGEDCVVVSHGGPLKLLAALLRGAAPDLLAAPPPLGSITRIAY